MSASASAKLKTNMLQHIHKLITMLLVMSSFFVAAQIRDRDNDAATWEVYADTLVAHHDFAGGIVLYNKLMDKSKLAIDDDYRVLYKRAYAYFGADKNEEALKDLNQYLARIPDPQALMMRSYVHEAMGNEEAQLKDINDIVSNNPDDPELLRWRASVLMEGGHYKDARKDIKSLLQRAPDADLQDYLGLSYYYDNNADSAIVIFDQVLAKYPDHIQTYLYASSLCLEQEAYSLALYYIDRGLHYEPGNTTLLFYKGSALVESNQLDEGCSCLRRAFAGGMDDAGDYLEEYCYRPQ